MWIGSYVDNMCVDHVMYEVPPKAVTAPAGGTPLLTDA